MLHQHIRQGERLGYRQVAWQRSAGRMRAPAGRLTHLLAAAIGLRQRMPERERLIELDQRYARV